MVVKWDPTAPSNWRATSDLQGWMGRKGRIGIGAQMLGVAQGVFDLTVPYLL
jgi:hypothetical protein